MHLRISYSKDAEGHEWYQHEPIPIPQNGHAIWSPVLQWIGADGASTPSEGVSDGTLWLFYAHSTAQCRAPGCVPQKIQRPPDPLQTPSTTPTNLIETENCPALKTHR
eukprot:5005565-Pyramimonas_sp.AAC.1